jgi:hypothetical protein
MTGRHTITPEELDEWLRRPQWRAFATSISDVSHKSLEVDAAVSSGPVFRVVDHGETKFLGTDKAAAIGAYNAAR